MKKDENIVQKIFGSFAFGNSKVPLRSNVYLNGQSAQGYSPIGQSSARVFDFDKKSPLLGSASPSNRLSSYYEKIAELRGYQLLDISKLATNFFADYIINFLADESNGGQVCTILNEDGSNNATVTDRINKVLTKDIKIFDYIKDHVQDYVYYGGYFSMLRNSRDEEGHLKFRVEELLDPIAVVSKKKRNKDGEMEEVFLAKGDDNVVYEIPKDEIIYVASNNLRLVNDLSKEWDKKTPKISFRPTGKSEGNNRERVLRQESYAANEPLFYSLILKVKELIIKELLVSLISLRDLSSVQIFLLQFDKSIPLETASDLCAKATKLANNTNELASFLTSQFDVVSFIENSLTQSAKFVPDYNSTLGGKNSMLPLDKLSDKLLDIMQTLDQCKANVLGPLGLPSTILDSTSGSKWMVLQQSERANSRVAAFMSGIKDSVTALVCAIYRVMYGEDIDPSQIKLHVCEKTSVEYNNQINQSESISSLVTGMSTIVANAIQVLDQASPLIDPATYLNYIQNLLKDIDPNAENIITEETINAYAQISKARLRAQLEQQGVDVTILDQLEEEKARKEQEAQQNVGGMKL